jgi:hypothetical protein
MASGMTFEAIWTDVQSAQDDSRLQRFLTEGGRVDLASTVHGGTLLHLAAGAGRGDLVAELVRRGANLNARDRYGWTPLRVALHADLASVDVARAERVVDLVRVRAMLEHGADPNVADDHGKTIWNVAVGYGPMQMQWLHHAIAAVESSVGKRLKVLVQGETATGDCGQAFWISTPDGMVFGVTGHSLNDAVRIIRSFRFSLPEDEAQLNVVKGATIADLDATIRKKIGPLDLRGLWYPFIWHGLPPWLRG